MLNRYAIVVAALLALSAAAGCDRNDETYVTINGRRWDVELATTPENRFLGMSGRQDVPADTGMLFVFRDSQPREFVMRGCLVPLDIAFIDEHLRIVAIHTMAVAEDPTKLRKYASIKPAMYALEVAAGSLGQARVNVGDAVTLSPAITRR